MTGSRGALSVRPMFSAEQMQISNPDQCLNLVVKEFVKRCEAAAKCSIQMPRGVLLLLMVPGNAASGAIYLYDRTHKNFYGVHFEGPDDDLTFLEFEQLIDEYRLVEHLENPALLLGLAAAEAAKA
jgi:hypothetical protein